MQCRGNLIVSNLCPSARELIRAGRSALRPTTADRERIAQALLVRLSPAAGALSSAPVASAAKASATSWPLLSTVIVGLAASGLFVTGALRWDGSLASTPQPAVTVDAPALAAAPAAAVAATVTPTAAPLSTAAAPSVNPPVAEARVEDKAARPATRRRPSDHLGEEVAILSRAQSELHAARFADVLGVLDEHARKFPSGALAQERRATRVMALCSMGRLTEARAELAKLSPASVHQQTAREVCAAQRK